MPPLDPAPRKILVRGTNWIGDLVLISPALRALRETYPEARISLLVRRHLAAAMRPNPWVDEVLPCDPDTGFERPIGMAILARRLRRERFDLAVLFPKAFGAALLARMASIPIRAGWKTDLRGGLITHGRRLETEDRRRHHMLQFLEVAGFAGCEPPAEPKATFHLGGDDRRSASGLLGPAGLDASFLLAVHAGSSKPPRSWHPERFAEAAGRILEGRRGILALLGGQDDRRIASQIARTARCETLDLAGRTSIGEMAALIERADLLLSNDSGPMHLAAALQTPVVPVFGPGTPRQTAPMVETRLCRPVTLAFPCSPCRQDFFRECSRGPCGKPYCLEDLPVERVVETALELLGSG
jgi:heptosyltransferase-2